MTSLKEAQEISGIGYWELDLSSKELNWSNQVFEIFGEDISNFMPSLGNIFERVHHDDLSKVKECLEKGLDGDETSTLQHRILVNGEVRHVIVKCGNVRDHSGTPIKKVGSIQDITESIAGHHRLESSRKLFKAISNQTTEGITVADHDGNYVYVNEAFCKMSGYTEDELLKLTVFDMKAHSQDHSSFKNSKEEMEGKPVKVILRKKTGEDYYTEIIGDVIDVDGDSLVLGTIRDVTERVKQEELINQFNAELESMVEERTNQLNETIQNLNVEVDYRKGIESELKESLATKEVLFKEVTHRVKNNMQIISSLINLQKSTLDEEACEFLDQISRRIHSMALIHETLYKTNEFKEIRYDEYLRSLIKYIRESYFSEQIKFELQADQSSLPLEVGTSLGMIVMELVMNAIKHAFNPDDRHGVVRIEFQEPESGTFVLSIADNGCGLPAEIDINATKTLGLQLVTTLVEQIAGVIDHSDENSAGAVFTIKFTT